MIIRPEKITIHEQGQKVIEIDTPYISNAYQYEAQAVMEMLELGETEHPLMPLDETIEIMETMDEIRRNIKLSYPGE